MACFFIILFAFYRIFLKFKISQYLFNNKINYGTPNSNQINTYIVIHNFKSLFVFMRNIIF